MTALRGLERLEAVATLVDGAGGPAREVLVSFGEASLTLTEFDDTPIDHWPLGTLRRVPGPHLTLAPDRDAPERLTLADSEMEAAIRAVCADLDRDDAAERVAARARRRPRGLRRALAAAALAAGGWALWAGWDPAVRWVAERAPIDARAALGDAAIERFAGPALCDGDPRALAALARATGARAVAVADLPGPLARAAPGGRVLLSRAAVEAGPGTATAAIRAALAAADERPPTGEALRRAAAALLGAARELDFAETGLIAAAAATLSETGVDPAAPAEPAPLSAAQWKRVVLSCVE